MKCKKIFDYFLTFCLIGVNLCQAKLKEVKKLADEKKVIVDNEDGDSAEINANFADSDDIKQENQEEESVPANEIELLRSELENVKTELATTKDQFLRLHADFDNFRKRTAKEKTELAATIEQAFLKDLLPLLDNLSRAAEAAEQSGENVDIETLRKGIDMIKQETVAVMGKHGLEPIEVDGKPFDPNFHQAVGTIKDESKDDGTIGAELQRGYVARGRVIRPSMVQVVKND